MSSGKFFVARSIWDHLEFAPAPFSEREAWLWMLSEAAWRPCQIRSGTVVIDLDRAQLSHSLRFMADRWSWKKDRVRRFLTRLEKRDMIATRNATGGATGQLLITICNYDKYQADPERSATADATAREPDSRQQRDSSATKKKNLKKENKENTEGGRSRSSRMHPDAILSESFREEAEEIGLSAAAAEAEFLKFKDYYLGQPGQKGVKANWTATWRYWCRNAIERPRPNGRDSRRFTAADVMAARQAGFHNGDDHE
jgi:hypothetical protein